MRDVWITGVGAVTPLGVGVGPFWNALLAGTSGIKPIEKFDTQGLPCARGAELAPLSPDEFLGAEEITGHGVLAAAAISAARQALADAGWLTPQRTCRQPSLKLFLGTSNGELNDIEQSLRREWAAGRGPDPQSGVSGYRERQPNDFLQQVARALGLRAGQSLNTNTCAAAGYAISLAADQIRLGKAEQVLCGAADLFGELVQAGFINLRALAPVHIQPFSAGRNGTMLGDAAVAFMLESGESVRQRGARPWARVAGEGWSADAYHISAPSPQGAGLVIAMRLALQAARLAPEQISCVVAHGTGTPSNDREEARALREVFGSGLGPVTAFKPRVGHSQGAAQAADILAAILMLRHGVLLPILNYSGQDEECRLPAAIGAPRETRLDACMVNAMGFGGNNLSLILQRPGQGPDA